MKTKRSVYKYYLVFNLLCTQYFVLHHSCIAYIIFCIVLHVYCMHYLHWNKKSTAVVWAKRNKGMNVNDVNKL